MSSNAEVESGEAKVGGLFGFRGAAAVAVVAPALPLPISTGFLLMVLAAPFGTVGVAYSLPRLLEATALAPDSRHIVELSLEDIEDDHQDILQRAPTSAQLMTSMMALLSSDLGWI